MQLVHGGHVGEVDGRVVIYSFLGARGVELTTCVSICAIVLSAIVI